jgi:hypothetical protein
VARQSQRVAAIRDQDRWQLLGEDLQPPRRGAQDHIPAQLHAGEGLAVACRQGRLDPLAERGVHPPVGPGQRIDELAPGGCPALLQQRDRLHQAQPVVEREGFRGGQCRVPAKAVADHRDRPVAASRALGVEQRGEPGQRPGIGRSQVDAGLQPLGGIELGEGEEPRLAPQLVGAGDPRIAGRQRAERLRGVGALPGKGDGDAAHRGEATATSRRAAVTICSVETSTLAAAGPSGTKLSAARTLATSPVVVCSARSATMASATPPPVVRH